MKLFAQSLHGEDIQKHVQRVEHVAEHGREQRQPALLGESGHCSRVA
jgi:hypothetical protein